MESRFHALGLRARIIIALAVVLTLFIVLTELSVSQLVRVAMERQSISDGTGEEGSKKALERMERRVPKLQNLILFYMVTGAVVALVLGTWALTRLVVRPLSRVTQAVERIADGKLDTKVPIEGASDLIDLGVAFNRMTVTIRDQQRELESRLDQLEQSSNDLRETQDRLIRAARLASVGTLAAGVAHEIGNPLAGVLGLLDAIEGETDQEQLRRYRDLMRKEIQRIDRIIDELLLYARPSRTDTSEKPSSTVERVVEHVRSLLGTQKLFDNIEIKTETKGGPWVVAISSDNLTQILVNLSLNSAQAMEGKGTIVIGAERVTGWRPTLGAILRDAVRIRFSDDGPGIAPEHAGSIFDPFFSTKGLGQGTGLGLAICQSICERAGGEIVLDLDGCSGSCFVITVPLA